MTGKTASNKNPVCTIAIISSYSDHAKYRHRASHRHRNKCQPWFVMLKDDWACYWQPWWAKFILLQLNFFLFIDPSFVLILFLYLSPSSSAELWHCIVKYLLRCFHTLRLRKYIKYSELRIIVIFFFTDGSDKGSTFWFPCWFHVFLGSIIRSWWKIWL